ILIVEDEYFLAKDISQCLIEAGADTIGPFATAEDALQRIDGMTLSGALLDINLKGRMAFDVAEALKKRNIPFVFATGYDGSVIPPHLRGAPRWEKPFDTDELVRTLTQIFHPLAS